MRVRLGTPARRTEPVSFSDASRMLRLEAGRARCGEAEPAARGEVHPLALGAGEQAVARPAAGQRRQREPAVLAAVGRGRGCGRARTARPVGQQARDRRARHGRRLLGRPCGPPCACRAAVSTAKPAHADAERAEQREHAARGGSRPGAPAQERGGGDEPSRPRGRRRRSPARVCEAEPRPQRAEQDRGEQPRDARRRSRAGRGRCRADPPATWLLPSAIRTPSVAA